MPRVPTTREVVPGAPVNIILKADQPTGRTVSGTIADVLTRGNHPRGIKVRLTDGRVGRVQSMGTAGSSYPPAQGQRTGRAAAASEADSLPSQNIGLDAYMVTTSARPRRRGPRQHLDNHDDDDEQQQQLQLQQPVHDASVVTCPVCGDFEGDEIAVAHHVAAHFAD
ncbi:hypothetical protein BDV26DRAFT_268683 [Aspergillus bertholletiae]|uniref:UBZ4-type domain-containing protein n=1 Tax=Aspergillus bertholletiae TaxID=1226010 RepID=A0A5N7B1L1_9EURO|nr:hypothetical protein BDV26DRAFT_268683 [Aspergillus bertholletiae]